MILEKVKDTIKRYNLIDRNDLLVVGVSGGPDSVAMLYLLNSLKQELKINLHIAHLDHMLRKDSYKDKEFVEDLAQKLKLPVTTAQINVSQLAGRGSLEEIARNARLGFFFRVAKNIKTEKIALGHNLNDQAETVLMRILRGTGLQGLSGMLPKIEIASLQIIRPLIEIRRPDIEAFLKKRGIKARLDKSNLNDIYFRNKIRNRLMPVLEKEYNKNIKGVLSNMAESIAYDYDYLADAAIRARVLMKTKIDTSAVYKPRPLGRGKEKPLSINPERFDFAQHGSERGEQVEPQASTFKSGPVERVDLDKFLKLHTAIRRLALRMAIVKLKGDTRRITFQHIKELEDLVANRPTGSIVDLPKGISVVKAKKYLSFYRR